LTAQLDGQPVKGVFPGATVELSVKAQAADAGRVQYRWSADSGFGSIVPLGGNRARWIAPYDLASGQIHVLVSGGRAGFAQGSIVMTVGALDFGLAAAPDPPYAQNVVANGMMKNQEYIPPYKNFDASATTSPFPGPFLTLRSNIAPAMPADYYKIVVKDQNGVYDSAPANCTAARCTLGGWLTANGWNRNGGLPQRATEARTVFLNNNDLGYVRDMHCRSPRIDANMTTVACWVTNYSDPANQEVTDLSFPPRQKEADLQRDFTAAERMLASNAKATVTMEYRKIEGVNEGNPVVTFIAYGNPPSGGTLGDSLIDEGSDQDGFGKRPVPGMCNNCHGGDSFRQADDGTFDANVSGRFIVFDLSTFIFPADTPWTRSAQEAAFNKQNMAVLETNPNRAAITELINGWYANGNTMDDKFVPPGWQRKGIGTLPAQLTSEKLYLNVVRTCRTCHTALRAAISWNTYQQFTGADIDRVCGTTKDMPHAAISYLNFWRFMPPDLDGYRMGGPAYDPKVPAKTNMKQPFLDMGAFLGAIKSPIGDCKNTKGRPMN
jgi:hypothetical protein